MKVAITGTSGLVGSRLVPFLTNKNFTITRISHENSGGNTISWKPEKVKIFLRENGQKKKKKK